MDHWIYSFALSIFFFSFVIPCSSFFILLYLFLALLHLSNAAWPVQCRLYPFHITSLLSLGFWRHPVNPHESFISTSHRLPPMAPSYRLHYILHRISYDTASDWSWNSVSQFLFLLFFQFFNVSFLVLLGVWVPLRFLNYSSLITCSDSGTAGLL